MNDAMEYFTDHPAYVVIYGLGGLCLLLVIVAVVIIVTSPARRFVTTEWEWVVVENRYNHNQPQKTMDKWNTLSAGCVLGSSVIVVNNGIDTYIAIGAFMSAAIWGCCFYGAILLKLV